MTVYVYNGMEIELTGRVAQRKRTKHTRRTREPSEVVDELVEIKSVDDKLDFKEWVKREDLYEVMDDSDDTIQ